MNLPPVRGTLIKDAPLGAQSWFECGGAADMLFEPADFNDLADFLKNYDGPVTILGGMANTIIRDGGVRGAVIRLGKNFGDVKADGTKIIAGAGALNGSVAALAVKAGIGGLEFLSGVPGTVGGAVRMNAGAYGAEMKNILREVTVLHRDGLMRTLKPADLHMAYRHTDAPADSIFTQAVLEGIAEDAEIVRARLKDIKTKRQTTQPIAEKTGGSTFANPDAADLKRAGLPEDLRAWQVIERVGGRGLMIGGAQMSEKHCNFMINTGSATAADLEALGDELIRRAHEDLGVNLRWEIRRIGEF
jgi:UDP-N-acetylmuramate dehydrogenase